MGVSAYTTTWGGSCRRGSSGDMKTVWLDNQVTEEKGWGLLWLFACVRALLHLQVIAPRQLDISEFFLFSASAVLVLLNSPTLI